MTVCPIDGLRTVVGKEGYRSKSAPTAHSDLGVRRSAHRWVHSRSRHPKSEGWKGMGPLAASTWVHEHRGHSGPRSSLGRFQVHGFSSKKSNEPSEPVERTRELYGLATQNLESVTS